MTLEELAAALRERSPRYAEAVEAWHSAVALAYDKVLAEPIPEDMKALLERLK